jgi:spore coat protein U-like protein
MYAKKQLGLVAAVLAAISVSGAAIAATADSTVTVSATLTTACEVSPTASISFGSFAALQSTGDKTANSGSSFKVACSASATPAIYAVGTRSMANGVDTLPFNLSLTSGAASNDLSSDSGAPSSMPGSFVQDGSLHDVVLYAKTYASDFKALPSGAYTTNVTVSVAY